MAWAWRSETDDLEASEALATAIETAEAPAARHGGRDPPSLAWTVARMGDLQEALPGGSRGQPTGGPAPGNAGAILQRLGDNQRALQSYAVALEAGAADDRVGPPGSDQRSILPCTGDLDAAVEDLGVRTGSPEGRADAARGACAHNLGSPTGDAATSPGAHVVRPERSSPLGAGQHRLLSTRGGLACAHARPIADARAAVHLSGGESRPADASGPRAGVAGDAETAPPRRGQLSHPMRKQGAEAPALFPAASPTRRQLRRALALVSRLDSAGWEWEATRARIAAGRVAFDLGDMEATLDVLGPLEGAAWANSHLDKMARAETDYMLAMARGMEREARRAVAAGLRLLDRFRAGLGSPEMRAGVARHGIRLVTAAIDDALRAGRQWWC